jgi:hypothetical protein
MSNTKTFTIRLPFPLFEQTAEAAEVAGQTLADFTRSAISKAVNRGGDSKRFDEIMQTILAGNAEILVAIAQLEAVE